MIKKKVAQVEELEAKMIRHVRYGRATSRLELAQACRLAASTTGIYVDRLIEDGFLQERPADRPSRRGRPAQVLSIRGEAGCFIGIQMESRQLCAVSVDFSGDVLTRHQLLIDEVTSAPQLIEVVNRVIEEVNPVLPLLGIGISVPVGERYSFAYAVGDAFPVPAAVGDWAQAAALGCMVFHRGIDYNSFANIVVADSVGVGKIINGELYRCEHDGGTIGSIKLGLSETYGETADDVISSPAIVRYVTTQLKAGKSSLLGGKEELELADIIAAAQEGDELAREALKRAMRGVGWLAHLLVLIVKPEVIFLSGALNPLGEWLRTEVQAALQEFSPVCKTPVVTLCSCNEEMRGLGAAALALDAWKPKRRLSEGGAAEVD